MIIHQDQSHETSEQRLQRLEEENRRLKGGGEVRFKVADKGGLSMYGLGQRFPITLYIESWEILLANTDKIREAIEENRRYLKRKGD